MKLSYGNFASCLNLNKLGQYLGEHVDKLWLVIIFIFLTQDSLFCQGLGGVYLGQWCQLECNSGEFDLEGICVVAITFYLILGGFLRFLFCFGLCMTFFSISDGTADHVPIYLLLRFYTIFRILAFFSFKYNKPCRPSVLVIKIRLFSFFEFLEYKPIVTLFLPSP